MQLHVLTNCSISLVLWKNLTVHLSANKKMMITEVRATMDNGDSEDNDAAAAAAAADDDDV